MNRLALGALSLFALALSTNLYAEEANSLKWYGGIAIGGGESDLGISDFNDGSIQSGAVTTEEITRKFFIGYPFTFKKLPFRVLVEGGYLRLPNVKFDGISDGTGTAFQSPVNDATWAPDDVTGRGKADGLTAAGVLDYRIWRGLHVQGKLGLLLWESEMTMTNISITNPLFPQFGPQTLETITQSDDGLDVFYGLGFEYSFLKRFAVRLEYERYALSYKFVGGTNYDVFTAGFIVRF